MTINNICGSLSKEGCPIPFTSSPGQEIFPPLYFLSSGTNTGSCFNTSFAAPRRHSKKMQPQELFKSQNQILMSTGSKWTALTMTPNAMCLKQNHHQITFSEQGRQKFKPRKQEAVPFILPQFSSTVFSSSNGHVRVGRKTRTRKQDKWLARPLPLMW